MLVLSSVSALGSAEGVNASQFSTANLGPPLQRAETPGIHLLDLESLFLGAANSLFCLWRYSTNHKDEQWHKKYDQEEEKEEEQQQRPQSTWGIQQVKKETQMILHINEQTAASDGESRNTASQGQLYRLDVHSHSFRVPNLQYMRNKLWI